MAKIIVTIPDDMYTALNTQSDSTGAPVAAIVRRAIEQHLETQGYKIEGEVVWGGPRTAEKHKRERGQNPSTKHRLKPVPQEKGTTSNNQ